MVTNMKIIHIVYPYSTNSHWHLEYTTCLIPNQLISLLFIAHLSHIFVSVSRNR